MHEPALLMDAGRKESGSVHKWRDEDVQKVMEVISRWRNPFEKVDDLVSLSSGCAASNALKEDLLKAGEKGHLYKTGWPAVQ